MHVSNVLSTLGFSAIARSVMISAGTAEDDKVFGYRFSAIARSVMISAFSSLPTLSGQFIRFSAIARSVMISAP